MQQTKIHFSNPRWQYSNNYIQPKKGRKVSERKKEEKQERQDWDFRGTREGRVCVWLMLMVIHSPLRMWMGQYIHFGSSVFLIPCLFIVSLSLLGELYGFALWTLTCFLYCKSLSVLWKRKCVRVPGVTVCTQTPRGLWDVVIMTVEANVG